MEYNNIYVSDITYLAELIPPSCFRKKAGGINSQTLVTIKNKQLQFMSSLQDFHKLSAH